MPYPTVKEACMWARRAAVWGLAGLALLYAAQHAGAADVTPPTPPASNTTQRQEFLTPEERAWLEANPAIKVALSPIAPYMFLEKGQPRGYLVDLIQELCRIAGLQVEFSLQPVSESLALIQDSQVDVIAGMIHSAERAKFMLFSEKSLPMQMGIFARKDNTDISDLNSLRASTIATYPGYAFDPVLRKVFPEAEFVVADDDAEAMFRLVAAGEADAAVQEIYSGEYIIYDKFINIVQLKGPCELPGAKTILASEYSVSSSQPLLKSILDKSYAAMPEAKRNSIWSFWFGKNGVSLPQQPDAVLSAEEKLWLKEHPVITLGGGNFPPLDFFDEAKGQPDGVGADYAKLIGRFLGIEFKLVSGAWQDILNKAKSKEIDGIRLIFKSKEREKYLSYTKPVVKISHAIVMKKETEGASSLKELSHKRVGTMQGLYAYHYLKEHYPDLDLITYPTWEKVLRALVNNEVEAVVGTLPVITYMTNKLFITNLKVTALPTEMEREAYLGIRPDWPELSVIINKAIDAITIKQKYEIKQKWIALDEEAKETDLSLTTEEQVWLDQNHTVKVRATDWPPYMITRKDGPPQGISAEYLDLIKERTGINFEYEATKQPFAKFLETIKQRSGADMTLLIGSSPAREEYLSFTKPYITTASVIFAHEEDALILDINGLIGRSLAIPRGYNIQKILTEDFPGIKLVLFDSDYDALKAVAMHQADAYIGNLIVASHIIRQQGLSDLKVVAPAPPGGETLSMGVRKDWPELTSIIDKTLASITEEEKTAISNKYIAVRYETGVKPAVVFKSILAVIGIASFVILAFVVWNRTLQNRVRSRTAALQEEIAERKVAEESLRKSEAEFRHMVEQSPLSIQILSPDGRIVQVNEAFMKLWGVTEEKLPEVLEKYNILEDEELKATGLMPLIEMAFKGDSVTLPNIEYDAPSTMESLGIDSPDTVKRWIQARLYPVKNSKGEIVNIVDIEEDTTERMISEQKVQEHQQRLKALALQLTLAEEQERRRIAANLHDHVGQALAMSRLQLASAINASEDAGFRDTLAEVSQTLLQATRDTRELIFDLSSPTMNEIGLGGAISEWAEQKLGKSQPLEFQLIDDLDGIDLEQDLRAILFRSVRELLTNTCKHARANRVKVELQAAGGSIRVAIQDDGVGFDPDRVVGTLQAEGGFGLFSIQERMADLGGSLEIASEQGKGCRVVLTAPLA